MKTINIPTMALLLLLGCSSEPVSQPATGSSLVLGHAGSGNVVDVIAFTEFPSPTVVVTENGVPKAGVTVNWAKAVGEYLSSQYLGTLSPATSVTDEYGQATTHWQLDRSTGIQGLLASIEGSSAPSVVFRANAIKGPPTRLISLRGDDQVVLTSGTFIRLDGQALDVADNSVTSLPVEWIVVSGPVTISQLPGLSATVTWTGGAGTAVVRMHLLDSPLSTDFRLAKVLPFATFKVRPGPPYFVGIAGTTFKSFQNWPAGQLDIIPVGSTLTFVDLNASAHAEIIIGGLAGYPGGVTIPRFGHADVYFDTPGLYTYFSATAPLVPRSVLVR